MQIEVTCLNCGSTKTANQRSNDPPRKFCSAACYRAYEKIHGRDNPVRPVKFCCQTCGKDFFRLPGDIRSYRKKFGVDPRYCSIPCSGEGRRAENAKTRTFTCKACGKTKPVSFIILPGNGKRQYNNRQQFCDMACKAESQRQRAAKRFADGTIHKHVKRHGYVWISIPANMSNTGKKREMLEHRYVMEKMLGRPLLPGETVHHKNGDRSYNEPENLELFSSRHGPGQRVIDKIAFAIEMIQIYPEFARQAGFELKAIPPEH